MFTLVLSISIPCMSSDDTDIFAVVVRALVTAQPSSSLPSEQSSLPSHSDDFNIHALFDLHSKCMLEQTIKQFLK